MQQDFTIQRDSLGRLPIFLAVAERRSFSAAATALALSPSAVSQAIAALERELGTALFVRTTRSVNLTDAGKRLAHDARPAVAVLTAALETTAARREELSGTLRLNVPHLACHLVLPPLLTAYVRKHPEMRVDVVVDDRNVDIVADGFDAGVRLHEEVQKDMVAVRISAAFRFVVVASPAYFERHGEPRHPEDLVRHACLPWRSLTTGAVWRWEFEHEGRELEIAVDGPVTSTDAHVLVACACEGLGFAYVPEHDVRRELATGRLRHVLDSYCLEVPGLFLYYPRAAQRVPKLAAFVACARVTQRGRTSRRQAANPG
jgi:DNA-binding transcriptional LysR family regulator